MLCESANIGVSPKDSRYVYGGCYQGLINEMDQQTKLGRDIMPWPSMNLTEPTDRTRFRFNWTAPIRVSQHDGTTIYHGGNVLFRSTDRGQSWTQISPDLTKNDKARQGKGGGPITNEGAGGEVYGTIVVISESPHDAKVLYVGTDDGLVQLTRDGGKSWTNVTAGMEGLPEWGTVCCIEASPHDAGTAYVVVEAHRLDNMRPFLWKTTDFGKSWRSLSGPLAKDVYLHAVREDPKQKGLLFVGTERGIAFSRDDGASWQPLKLNLPTVAVHDLIVKGDDLVVGTMGRSIWILDDLTALRAWQPETAKEEFRMFPPLPVTNYLLTFPFDGAAATYAGTNPPSGAVRQSRDSWGARS